MIVTLQTEQPRVKRRRFRVGRWALRVFLVLLLGVVGLASWIVRDLSEHGFFLPWTADYDRAVYARVRQAVEADPHGEHGRPFDEVSRELGLDDVPWDDAAFQSEPGMYRIYHYHGFALHVWLRRFRAGITPATPVGSSAPPDAPERIWLLHGYSFVHVDGLDRQERMRRYWKAIQDECDRINAEMDRAQRPQPTPESHDP